MDCNITHIQSALQAISSPSSPDMIQQAQTALLQWEESNTDEYAAALMTLVGLTSDRADGNTSAAATLRLSAVLTLKSAIVRRWKDKGRGKIGVPKILLSEGIKSAIRQSLLGLILSGKVIDGQGNIGYIPNEITSQQLELLQDHPLQTNAASLLSKISRMDLPLKFHECIPTLVEGVKSSQGILSQLMQQSSSQHVLQQQNIYQTVLYNTMNCLENVLSEISTQRLLVDKKYRNSISLQYLGTVVEYGLIPSLNNLESLRSASIMGEQQALILVKHAILASRAVSYMMVSSFPKLVEEQSALLDQILTLIHAFLTQWLPSVMDNGVTTQQQSDDLQRQMKDLLQVHCGLIVALQQTHPMAFVKYITPYIALFNSSFMSLVGNRTKTSIRTSDQLSIAFLTFLANVVGLSKYAESDEVRTELKKSFTPAVVQRLSRTLLQLFPIHIFSNQNGLSGGDDEYGDDSVQWQDDPEGFYQYETQRSSDDDVGCASQNLFLALMESSMSKGRLVPWLTELLTNVVSQRLACEIECGISSGIDEQIISSALPLGSPSSTKLSCGSAAMDLICQWNAIYEASGLASSLLESQPGYTFQSWFQSSLGHCLVLLLQSHTQKREHLPILTRRIIWLLSCNAHLVNVSSTLNPLGLLASALSSHDICVRLSAVQAMEALLPYCENSPSVLHSIVEPTVPALFTLANDCTEVQSRSSCLDLLSNLVTYVGVTGGTLSNDTLNAIVEPLSTIWSNAVDQNLLLKRNVLALLSCVATFVGSDQITILFPLALPIIDGCFASQDNVFLVEEGLKVWLVFLRLSKSYDSLLGKLFIRAVELSKDLTQVKILMRITEHYILLGGATFLDEHVANIQAVLANTVGEVRPRGTQYIFLVIEALLISFPVQGASLLQNCGVLNKFIEACAQSYVEDEKSEPDRVIVLYLTALARVLLASPGVLQTLVPVTIAGSVFGVQELVHLYLMKFQVAGNGAHGLLFQKLWAMLLLSFCPPCQLESCSAAVLRKSDDIFKRLVYVFKNASDDGSNLLSYEVGYDEEEESVDIGTEMYETLLQAQRTRDIVFTTPFRDAVSSKLNGLEGELGGQYTAFLNTIDGDILNQLEMNLAKLNVQ